MIPEEIQTGLGEEVGGVFYLYGGDEYRKDQVARSLIEAHLDDATRDFNYDSLRGSEVDVETLASVLGTPPMMAEWRVVVVREVQALASSPRARDLLVNVATAPPPGLALILLCTEPSGAKFYGNLRKAARSAAFEAPSLDELPGWLMEWSRASFARELDEAAARALAQAIGADVPLLAQEMEKLATFVPSGGVITKDAVEAAGTRVPRQDRWEWFDLVGARRFDDALRGLPVLLRQGETAVGLVIGLGTHLLRIGLALDGGPRALEPFLPPRAKRFLAPRYQAQAKHWTADAVREALSGLAEVDRLLKASGIGDEALLESWILGRMAERGAAA